MKIWQKTAASQINQQQTHSNHGKALPLSRGVI